MSKGLALRFLSSKQWCISQDVLETMGGIAARDLDSIDTSAFGIPSPEAVEAVRGTRSDRGVYMRGDTAVINMTGVISRYAGMFEAYCGGTSTETLARNFTTALNDEAVKSIVIVCDSGGGEANGINELAAMIYDARGKKPVHAYVDGYCCSAAYWLASACDEITMDATAFVGSIGTVQTFRFNKEQEGVETLELVSSQSPYKRLDPRTKEGKEKYQATLDALSDVFIDSVARHRGVSRAKVLGDFGQGFSLMGQEAVDAGMADGLGSFEGLIKKLNKGESTMFGKKKTDAVVAEEVVAIPLAAEGVAEFITAQDDGVQAAFAAHFAPAPAAMAADNAADVVKAAVAAGVPEMSGDLIAEGVTLASATSQIEFASELKGVLAAAGMDSSLSALLAHKSDTAKMLAAAIHEAQACAVAADGIEAEAPVSKSNSLNASDIYAQRQA